MDALDSVEPATGDPAAADPAAGGPPGSAAVPAPAPAATSRRPGGALARLAGRTAGGGRRGVLLWFWALPTVVAAALTVAGRPPVVGDDVLQNYPLRVLVGAQLRHGTAPLWDPWLWSGTPLLGGSNAGAAYPGTWLFAVLPGPWAWAVNVVAVFGLAGTGTYLVLRRLGAGSGAALAAGAAFAYSGFLTGQLEHLGLVQGAALLPWLVLALGCRRAAARVGGVGTVLALVVLTGEPRAPSLAAAVLVVAAGAEALRRRGARLAYLAGVGGGVVLALALSAVYWLPALAWTDRSQRAGLGYAFFASGSLWPGWLLLLVLPYLAGGRGPVWPGYFGTYNFSELSPYAGLLAVVAAAALVPVALRRGGRRVLEWYALLALGLLLALGGYTPAGRPLSAVPVYGGERLQSRNLGLVDLALAVLLGLWWDRVVRARAGSAPPARRLAAALPAVAGAAAAGVALAWPGTMATVLLAPRPDFRAMAGYLATAVGLAAVTAVVVVRCGRWPAHRRSRWLGVLLAVDLALAAAGQSWSGPSPAVLAGTAALGRRVAALLPAGQRFAVYDPARNNDALLAAGAPDLNVLVERPSVQGYGSVVGAGYDAATGAHRQDSLRPAALTDGTFDRLRLGLLLARTGAFRHPLAAGSGAAGAGAARAAGFTRVRLGPAGAELALGLPVAVDRVRVRVAAPAGTRLQVGLRTGGGSVVTTVARVTAGSATVRLARPVVAVGVRLRALGAASRDRLVLADPVVAGPGGAARVDGPLAAALPWSHWRYAGTVGSLAAYRNERVAPPLWATAGARVRSTGAQAARVRAPVATLVVRSVAFTPGWTARLSAPGRRLTVPVRRDGVLQSIRVPPGRWTVAYRYRPPGLVAGAAATLAGLLVLAALGGAELRRRGRGPAPRLSAR